MTSAFPAEHRTQRAKTVAAITFALLLAGCASAPLAPVASLGDAEAAIQTAESDDASQYATAELDRARQNLMQANRAVAMDDMVRAKRLAEEATVTAKLASARTEESKAAAINEEMVRSVAAMREELQRAGGKS